MMCYVYRSSSWGNTKCEYKSRTATPTARYYSLHNMIWDCIRQRWRNASETDVLLFICTSIKGSAYSAEWLLKIRWTPKCYSTLHLQSTTPFIKCRLWFGVQCDLWYPHNGRWEQSNDHDLIKGHMTISSSSPLFNFFFCYIHWKGIHVLWGVGLICVAQSCAS